MNRKVLFAIFGLVAAVAVYLITYSLFAGGKTSTLQETPSLQGQNDWLPSWSDGRYGDRKVLIWLMPHMALLNMTDQRVKAFNDALAQRGADFALEWVSLESLGNYDENLREYMESGKQADLLYTGPNDYRTLTDTIYNSYIRAYQNDWLLPLDSILPEGLQNAIDARYWEAMRINGTIYGLPTDPVYARTSAILIKGDSVPAGITNDIMSLLPLLQEQTAEYPLELVNDLQTICRYLSYTYINAGIAMDNHGRVFNLLEDSDFLEYIKTARWFLENGYIAPAVEAEAWRGSVIISVDAAGDIFSPSGYITYTKGELNISSQTIAVGVAKKSAYSTEALTLLSWLVSDKELADLLVYGIESVDYQIIEGTVSSKHFPFLRWYTGLFAFTTQTDMDIPNVLERIKDYNRNTMLTPITGYQFDDRGYEDTIHELNELMEKFFFTGTDESGAPLSGRLTHGILTGHDPDYGAKLTDLRADLKTAGIDDLIGEVNRQYLAWRSQYGR